MKKLLFIFLFLFVFSSWAWADSTYYVYPGHGGTGTISNPWSSINWSTVNTALTSGNVTVYFSASNTTNTADANHGSQLAISRTNGTGVADVVVNRLTLDGCSYYYNGSTFVPNPGAPNSTYKALFSGNYPVTQGYGSGPSGVQRYITLRGFHIVGPSISNSYQAVYIQGISHWLFEYNDVSGGMTYFQYATYGSKPDSELNGGCVDIEYSNNTFTAGQGAEVFYMGSVGETLSTTYGYVYHTNVRILNNVSTSVGGNECLDIKGHIHQLVVRGNILTGGGDNGTMASLSAGLFEQNLLRNGSNSGDKVGFYLNGYNPNSGSYPLTEDLIIRNNIIYGMYGTGLRVDSQYQQWTGHIYIYNNSITNNGADGILIEPTKTMASLRIENNLVGMNTSYAIQVTSTSPITSFTHDHNDYYNTVSGFTRGATEYNVDPLFTSTSDLTLQASSPFRNGTYWGTNLYSAGVIVDYAGKARSPSGNFTMGAYEYGAGGDTTPPAAPVNLKVLGN
jgi:hypothetical protein